MSRFRIIDAEQRSAEWCAARSGRLTGSVADDMLNMTAKGSESAKRRNLRLRLVLERITGRPEENGFINAEMQRGIDLEPAARATYELLTATIVTQTGFLALTEHMAGCSLDGHVGNFDGIVEFKCPKSSTHLGYLRSGVLPVDYYPQVLHNLWVSGAAWCDFLSYDDRFPVELQTFLVRVERDAKAIASYEAKALAFLDSVETELQAIRTMANPAAVLAEAVAHV